MRIRDSDRITVCRAGSAWEVWRGLDWLRNYTTHEEAINFATEEARFEHFWREWYSKIPYATRGLARNYWDFFMTKGERNAW